MASMQAICARTAAKRFSSTMRRASVAVSFPVTASDIRVAITSRAARLNSPKSGDDLLRSRWKNNPNSRLGRTLKVMGSAFTEVEMTNQPFPHYLVPPRRKHGTTARHVQVYVSLGSKATLQVIGACPVCPKSGYHGFYAEG